MTEKKTARSEKPDLPKLVSRHCMGCGTVENFKVKGGFMAKGKGHAGKVVLKLVCPSCGNIINDVLSKSK